MSVHFIVYSRNVWLILLSFLVAAPAVSDTGLTQQPDTADHHWRQRISISGYVKYLQSSFIVGSDFGGIPTELTDQLLGKAIHDHLIHHRLNMQISFGAGFYLQTGWRNRLFYGDQTRLYRLIGQDYGKEVDRGSNDLFSLSGLPLNERAWVMHSVLDRLYVEWRGQRNEIRLGRQRVNWGVSTLWNPNDLFNAYSFIDFDYEERPGADALRWIHYLPSGQQLEVAIRPSDTLGGTTIAGLFKGYFPGVNYQILSAWHRGDIALGGGWEADLWQGAWKGETTLFYDTGEEPNRGTAVAFATDWMRTWGSGLLLGGGYFLNTAAKSSGNLLGEFSTRLDVRNLYPYRHSVFLQAGYTISPLAQVALASVYSPGEENALFISPVITYSLATDWDLDLTGQVLVRDDGKTWNSPLQAFYLRLRWSY